MTKTILLAASAVMLATPALAQAGPVAEKSSEQIVCELTGDCGGNTPAATKDMPDTRGFKLYGGPAKAATKAPSAPSQPARITPRPESRAPSVAGRAPAARITPGRTNLSIGFRLGSAELDASGISQATKFLGSLQDARLSGKRFVIAGHTDALGSRESNLDLSRRRAQSLVDYLASKGIERSRFEVKGYGFDQPLPGLGAKSPANRRVEIVRID